MLSVVCIHAFTWAPPVSRGFWALSCPGLIGFMVISGWFGIHLRLSKVTHLLVTFVCCALLGSVLSGARGFEIVNCLSSGRYWYVWAYLFVMLLSPLIDGFVEQKNDARSLVVAFITTSLLLWGWQFAVDVGAAPTVFRLTGSCRGVVFACIYVQVRIMRQLGWDVMLATHKKLVLLLTIISGGGVFMGFRHNSSFVAFSFALCGLMLIRRCPIPRFLSRVIVFLGPSVFSVYILHMPFQDYFPSWEEGIRSLSGLPHLCCQFLLALAVFFCCILLDMPRRLVCVLIGRINLFKSSQIDVFESSRNLR